MKLKCELYNDSMQSWKCYPIQKAQLIIADVPYNVGNNFYGSNPMWYIGGDNKNGESKLAGKAAFTSDFNFNLYEYFHFCSRLMKKEPKKAGARGRSSDAPCMIVFCSFEQTHTLILAAGKCKAAYHTDEWHGYGCEITDGACMFLFPDSKVCAEQYGEGPDAEESEETEDEN